MKTTDKGVKATVLAFNANGKEFSIVVMTQGTGDEVQDIWEDICSYLCNIVDADVKECLEEIFEEYPDYEYELIEK